MKSYTDIEQSKKLAEFLPFESADMHYSTWTILDGEFIVSPNYGQTIESLQEDYGNQIIPCWSIDSLLNILREKCERLEISLRVSKKWNIFANKFDFTYNNEYDGGCMNLIDGCVEIIVKLKELKLS